MMWKGRYFTMVWGVIIAKHHLPLVVHVMVSVFVYRYAITGLAGKDGNFQN